MIEFFGWVGRVVYLVEVVVNYQQIPLFIEKLVALFLSFMSYDGSSVNLPL